MSKCSGAPDIGDLVTPRPPNWVGPDGAYWRVGEPRLIVATRGIEIQVMRDLELIWVRRDKVHVV
jgi:hypothetical protein